jgi:hypothetical protein
VAVVLVEAPAFPDKQQTTTIYQHTTSCSLETDKYPRNTVTLLFILSATMEFGRAGVLNEGAVAAPVRRSADDPSLT